MTVRIINADVMDGLAQLESESVHCVVTSPPYFGLRDYGVEGQIGLEPTPDAYVAKLVEVFREVRRVLRKDGTCWLNLGDSYASSQSNNGGYSAKSTLAGFTNPNTKGRQANDGARPIKINHGAKPKDLLGIPWRVAFALQSDGWWLRQDIIWSKPNPMPESVTDRCTKAHEYLFLLAKAERYFYDAEAIAEGSVCAGEFRNTAKKASRVLNGGSGSGNEHPDALPVSVSETRNRRSVWEVTTQPFPEAHFATFPPALIEPCIKAGCPEGGTVLDPFGGSGTTGLVADRLKRDAILIELNPEYAAMAERRIKSDCPMFADVQPHRQSA